MGNGEGGWRDCLARRSEAGADEKEQGDEEHREEGKGRDHREQEEAEYWEEERKEQHRECEGDQDGEEGGLVEHEQTLDMHGEEQRHGEETSGAGQLLHATLPEPIMVGATRCGERSVPRVVRMIRSQREWIESLVSCEHA